MADNPSEDKSDASGCLAALVVIPLRVVFLQWLWGITVAVAIWIWMAPGRLLAWTLSWPLFSGHLLLGLLAIAAAGGGVWLLFELVLQLIWPRQFLRAGYRATQNLQGHVFRNGEQVMQLDFVEFCDHSNRTASVKMLCCLPIQHGKPSLGIKLDQFGMEGIDVCPDQARISSRLRTLRQPTRTYLESLQRHGLEPLACDSIEAMAWQALLDSKQELSRLSELRKAASAILIDVKRVQQFSADNELLAPTRKRSLSLTPKLKADITRIDERCLELRCFGYKLYEFLNIPRSLRSFEISADMETTLQAQRGLSDELFEEIKLIEQAYGELFGD